MKYDGTTKVIVPYMDYDGNGQYALFTFRGSVDRRRLWAEVRKGVYRTTQRKIQTTLLKKISIFVPDTSVRRVTNEVINEWLGRITTVPESEASTDSEETITTSLMPNMPNSDGTTGQ